MLLGICNDHVVWQCLEEVAHGGVMAQGLASYHMSLWLLHGSHS